MSNGAKRQKLEATTAEVLLAFQTCPGVDSANIIDGGPALVKDASGRSHSTKPQGSGYYGLKIGVGGTV